jgi:uncharacterized protein involved in exopolysaccharide biosynthesis
MLNRLSTNVALEAAEAAQRYDLREILNFIWRQWKFIAAIAAVCLLVGVVMLMRQTPLYTASAQVLLEPRKEKAVGADAVLSDVALDLAMIESQMAIIRSTVFMRRVVEKERLVTDPEFGSGEPAPAAPSGKEADPNVIPRRVMGSIEALKGATTVARAGQGYVLAVSVTSVDQTRAARLANAVADAFVLTSSKPATRRRSAPRPG